MFQGRKAQKILANMLICLMMLTNPAVVPAVQAMTAAEKPPEQQQTAQDSTSQSVTDTVYTVDKSTNRQEVQVAAGTADGDRHLSTQPTTAKEKAFRFGNSLLSYYLSQGKNHGPQWLKTTSLSFFVGEDFKPVYSFEAIQPFGEINDRDSLWFWQGRYAHSGDASTANIGLGWRKLSADKHSMVGYNLFYDYGFQYDLARIGFGGEYFNKQAEYRFNVYHPVSGDRLTNVSYLDSGILYSYIRAVNGFDLEMGTFLSQAQWMKWYLKGYYYDNKHNDDELGYQLRTTMQISPRFQLEWGYRHSNLNHEPYVTFKYQMADKPSPSAKDDPKTGDRIDLSYKLLQPVERDNDIKTETYARLAAYTGSIRTAVTNSLSATPIVGARVQAYQNGAAVGSESITDASGNALINGLVVGTYTVKVTYSSFTADSSPVTVAKNQTAAAAVSLAVQGGSAGITVLDGQLQPVGGASVTATLSSTTVARAEKSWIDRLLGVQTACAATSPFSITITADANGVANFTNLPPGTYTFTVNHNGHTMKSQGIAIAISGSNNITMILPASGGNIHAVVKDGSGTAVSGAAVRVLSGTATVATGTTGSNGVAVMGGIAAGNYTLEASKANYVTNTTSVTITDGKTADASITLMAQEGTAQITVTDGTHSISGATVSTTVSGTAYSGTTNASGMAIISGVPVGNHTFTASATGYSSNTASITVTTSGGSAAIALTGAGGDLAVTVQDSGSHAISGAAVSTTVNGTTYSGTTNASGVATISGVPTGSYTFTASAAGYINNTTSIVVTTSGGSATVNLTGAGGDVAVTVQDSGSHAISGAAVSTTVNGTTYSGTTNASGVATISGVPTGTYIFTVSAADYINNTVSITVSAAGGNGTVSLTGAGGNVSVTVQDSGNHMISGATVSTTVNGTVYSGTTNASGVATISGVPTGTYTFTVSATGYTNNTASLAVTASGGIATVNLTGAGGNVSVTVQDSGSHAISGAVVSATVNGTTYSGTANASGVATISGVPTGTYIFTVSAAGYTNNTASITISAVGGSGTINLTGAGGNVSVTVQDSGSHVISGAVVSTTVNGTAYSGTANASGVATISGVPTGTYTFTVSATGYINNNASIAVTTTGGSATVSLTGAGGTVSVTVKDSDGIPISGATVSTTVNDTTYSGTANASGVATISGVPTGAYTFTASATGYINNTASITVTTSGSSGTIPLTLATSLVLQVQDSLGNLVMGQLPIVLTNTSTGKNYSRNLDKTSGTASFNGIPQGTYNCTVSDHFGNQFSYGQIHFVNQSMQLTIAVPMAFYDKIVVKNDNHSQLLWLQVTCTTAVSYNQYSTSDLIINFNAYILQGQKIELTVYAWVKWYDYYAFQTSATAAGGTQSINVNFSDFTNITSPTG